MSDNEGRALAKVSDDEALDPANEITAPDISKTQVVSPTTLQSVRSVTRSEVRVSYGVLTDPRSLAEYEAAVPGSGQLILGKYLEQTEREQMHRHQQERDALTADSAHRERASVLASRGQWFAFFIALAGLGDQK